MRYHNIVKSNVHEYKNVFYLMEGYHEKNLFAAIVSSLILAGCSSTNVVERKNVDRKITWEVGGHLPAQKGYEKI